MGETRIEWWGGGSYTLGGRPSPHVKGHGLYFLALHQKVGLVADFGTWEGRHLPALSSLEGMPVVATDVPDAQEMLARTQTAYPAVRCYEAPLHSLPFRNGEVGAALCWRVLHNLTRPGELMAALCEINRVMAFGAPLLIAVRGGLDQKWAQRSPCSFLRRCPNGNGGIREDVYFTPRGLRRMCALVGFHTEDIFKDVEGGEEIDGTIVRNHYVVAHLLKVSAPTDEGRRTAARLVVSDLHLL